MRIGIISIPDRFGGGIYRYSLICLTGNIQNIFEGDAICLSR